MCASRRTRGSPTGRVARIKYAHSYDQDPKIQNIIQKIIIHKLNQYTTSALGHEPELEDSTESSDSASTVFKNFSSLHRVQKFDFKAQFPQEKLLIIRNF